MRLHEAIEQAGEGGKIKRARWDDKTPWVIIDGYLGLEGGQSGTNIDSIVNLTADDWQVVQPEIIEVGDTVQWRCESEGCKTLECKVMERCNERAALLKISTGGVCACTKLVDQLTLIRKGGKKIVADVSILRNDDGQIVISCGDPSVFIESGNFHLTLEPMESE